MPITNLPTDAYTANAVLGELPTLRVTRTDTLTRLTDSKPILHTYRQSPRLREWVVCTYYPNGAVVLPSIDIAYGTSRIPLRALIQRWNRVLPPDWVAARFRRSRGYLSRRGGVIRLTYREHYHLDLQDGDVRFEPHGDVIWSGIRIYRASMDQAVAEQSGVEVPTRTDNFEWPDWVGREPRPESLFTPDVESVFLGRERRVPSPYEPTITYTDEVYAATAHDPDAPGMCPEEHTVADGGCAPFPGYSCLCHLHSWDVATYPQLIIPPTAFDEV